LWKKGASKDIVEKELADANSEDSRFDEGRVFGSMCARPLDIAVDAHIKFIEANLGNAGLYPGTQRLERDVVGAIAKLLNCEKASGSIVSGGTEANITRPAIFWALNR